MSQTDADIARQFKRELRTRLNVTRNAVPANVRTLRSNALCDVLTSLESVRAAHRIASYLPIRSEPDLARFHDSCRQRKQQLALPCVTPNGLLFREWPTGGELVQGSFGVLEPHERYAALPPSDVDVVLVPALAIDERGYRLGYGKGYYDHALPMFTTAIRIGVVFEFSLVPELPVEPHDQPVSWVVTDKGVTQIG